MQRKFYLYGVCSAVAIASLLACTVSGEPTHPYYKVEDLGTLGGDISYGAAINNRGQITGWSDLKTPRGANPDTGPFPSVHAFRTSPTGKISDPGTDLDFSGELFSQGIAIDDRGRVLVKAGRIAYRTSPTGTIKERGSELGTLQVGNDADKGILFEAASEANVYGMNASGQVVGREGVSALSKQDSSGIHGFRTRANGTLKDADVGKYLMPQAVNDKGQMTGQNDSGHAFRTPPQGRADQYEGTDLGVFASDRNQSSYGVAINIRGQVVGWVDEEESGKMVKYAFRTTPTGKISDPGTNLGALGGNYSRAFAINSHGDVVGISMSKDGSEAHAFLYTDHMIDLNDCIPPHSGIVLDEATGINDRGQIVCNGAVHGQNHAFSLTPVRSGR